MITWEYKSALISNETMIDYIDALNIEGASGWQLVGEYMCEGVDESVCTFMRPAPLDPAGAFSDN